MGCFNATCIVSNLQIEAGDKVRFLALTQSRYNRPNENCCYVSGRWQLRGPAIRAEYNDYGSIEDYKDDLVTKLFFKSFDLDAVEKGVGDNTCHDVQVRHGMSHDDWLTALWEGRVYVKDLPDYEPTFFAEHEAEKKVNEGIPTLAGLEELFKKHDVKIVTSRDDVPEDGFILNEISKGFVRIRFSGYSQETEELEKLLPVLHTANYAAMITCGTASSANYAEILVTPLPCRYRILSTGLAESKDKNPERPVTQVMIREDVWQILLGMTAESYDGNFTIKEFKAAAKEAMEKELEFFPAKPGDDQLYMTRILSRDRSNLFLTAIKSFDISGFSLEESFKFVFQYREDLEELESYVMELAELAYVQMIYSSIHGQWHPSSNNGQEGKWKRHREFLTKLLDIKGKWEDELEEDQEEEV